EGQRSERRAHVRGDAPPGHGRRLPQARRENDARRDRAALRNSRREPQWELSAAFWVSFTGSMRKLRPTEIELERLLRVPRFCPRLPLVPLTLPMIFSLYHRSL